MDSLTASFDLSEDERSVIVHMHATALCECSSDLLRDQLLCLLKTEQDYIVHFTPCRQALYIADEDYMPLEDWRKKICQWSFRVIDHFHLDREVVTVGMNLFDRFLVEYSPHGAFSASGCPCPSCKRSISSRSYQLAAMASLYLAIKLHRESTTDPTVPRRRSFTLTKFVDLSRGQFSQDDIVQMEQVVLSTLKWRVSPSTPMVFVNYLLDLLPRPAIDHGSHPGLVLHVLRELSRYLTELAVCLGMEVSRHAPSQTGFAAILVSMDLLTYEALPLSVRDMFCKSVYSVCGWREKRHIVEHLRTTLLSSLWPEMIFDECLQSEVGHPITLARDFGLLDVEQLCRPQLCTGSPPSSPRTHEKQVSWEESPVSILR
jgi:hypothetical protein